MYITVEPLNKGASHFVLCREVFYFSKVQNVLTIWENEHLGHRSVSFVKRLFLLCSLLRGSFIGGSTVHALQYICTLFILHILLSFIIRNFKSPIVKKSTNNNTNSSIAPAPNTYNIECSKDRSSVTVPSFKSKSIRDGLSLKTIKNPGPGQYNPKDTLLHRNVCAQRASFLSKTNRGESLINKNGAGPGPTDYATVPVTKTHPLPYYRQKHYLCISAPAIPLPAIPPPPGPGHYEIVNNDTDKIQLVTGSVFKSTSSRWSQTHHNELPGPGIYTI